MSLVADLQSLSELFSVPSRWTTGVEARDCTGRRIAPQDPQAVCFCLIGGIEAVTDGSATRYNALWHHLHRALPIKPVSLARFNDVAGYDHVIGLIDRALTLAISP